MIRVSIIHLCMLLKDTVYQPHAKYQYCAEYFISINDFKCDL
jgi:hypothetical protein